MWFVIGKGHEAGEGTRIVGTVASLPGPVWVTVRDRNHRLGSQSIYPRALDWKPCPVFPQATGNQAFQSKLVQCPSREGVEDPCNAQMDGWGPLPPCDFSRRVLPCACVCREGCSPRKLCHCWSVCTCGLQAPSLLLSQEALGAAIMPLVVRPL